MRYKTTFFLKTGIIYIIVFCAGCKKLVEISEPVDTITTSETFKTESNATSAIMGIYNSLGYGYTLGTFSFGNGLTTCIAGQSSDELLFFDASNTELIQFQNNELQSSNNTLTGLIWNAAYYQIYMCNAAIEGLSASNTLPQDVKNKLTGEAKFLRAFIHFYLVNLFGDIPLVTTTAWVHTANISRTPTGKVYEQIIDDLKTAQASLPHDFLASEGRRIRANAWAATALLARVYLYQGSWKNAAAEADKVIDSSGLFTLEPNLNSVFLKTSNEAILQWEVSDQFYPFATAEGSQIIPYDSTSNPNYYLTPQLLSAFEVGDKRKSEWIHSTSYAGSIYFYPYKYKIRQANSGDVSEYYMILRFAEQFLIRAEARAHDNSNLPGAIDDLNIIRRRAGLPELSGSLSQAQILNAVTQERRIELFAEWGHRWLDLKRTERADAVLGLIKPRWNSFDKLYPIPFTEIQRDPNLVQNAGY